jgi:hypothetical protein
MLIRRVLCSSSGMANTVRAARMHLYKTQLDCTTREIAW